MDGYGLLVYIYIYYIYIYHIRTIWQCCTCCDHDFVPSHRLFQINRDHLVQTGASFGSCLRCILWSFSLRSRNIGPPRLGASTGPTVHITLWWTYKKLWKMAIEIVDFPMKTGDFPLLCGCSPEGNPQWSQAICTPQAFRSPLACAERMFRLPHTAIDKWSWTRECSASRAATLLRRKSTTSTWDQLKLVGPTSIIWKLSIPKIWWLIN